VSDHYVRAVLQAYHALPGTPRRDSRHDRLLAGTLASRGVSLHTVKAAFALATARRTFRPEDSVPLGPIRSLAYFLPVVDELTQHPLRAAQLDALRVKLAAVGVELSA
jgi:hypothetical protein